MICKSRYIRILSAVMVAVLLSSLAFTALAVSYPYDKVCMEAVNLRNRANTTSTILKRIKAGDTVKILGLSGSFYRVEFEGAKGYAVRMYVDGTAPTPDPSPDPSLTMQAPPAVNDYPYDTTLTGYVKLRKKADSKGEVIKMLTAENVVTVLSLTDNGFARVRCDGKTGYVLAGYVNLAAIPTPTPVPTPTINPDAAKYTSLKKGDKSAAVTALQLALIELDYLSDTADGKFGAKTEAALKTFEKRNGLKQDGIAEEELQLLLYEGKPKNFKGYRKIIKTLAPVAGATIREGSVGDAVKTLETRLKVLGYFSGEADNVCDDATVLSIKAFQAKHGLDADGVMDSADQLVLYGGSAMGANVVVTPSPSPTPNPPKDTVRPGDKSDDAKRVQQRLKELGYYTGDVDGSFGPASVAALKAFQKKSALDDDGVCGTQTRAVLFGKYAIAAVATAPPVTSDAAQTPITEDNVIIITSGSRGEFVLRLQKRLQELGYYLSRFDGVYLSDDITAVRAFQSANGLKIDGKAGYQTQSLLYSDAAVRGNAGTSNIATAVLRLGSVGAEVTTLQNKLIELGYLTGTANGDFDSSTKKALMAYQSANSLTRDGVAGAKTMASIFGANAVANKITANGTLRKGDIGEAVTELQNRLIALGYLSGKADGNFGAKTSLALIAFQRANGLSADGIAGSQTIGKLNKLNAVSSEGEKSTTVTASAPNVASGSIRASEVRYANWYTEVKARCKLYPNATIYDFVTGISWRVNMFSLGAHADCEPLTAEDTANMNRAFGKTTWTPKAVWVVFSDGRVYMASTHNTPHDTWHIKDNNFDGHLCVHFPRTQAQVESIGSYATSHQKAIELGWAATLKRAAQGQ